MMSAWNSAAPTRPTFNFAKKFFQAVREDELFKSGKRDEAQKVTESVSRYLKGTGSYRENK